MMYSLRRFVNIAFHGKEPYEIVLRIALELLVGQMVRKAFRIMSREGFKVYFGNIFVRILKRLPFVRRRVEKEMNKTLDGLAKQFSEELTSPRIKLPTIGMSENDIISLMDTRSELDTKHWKGGKISGAIYHGDQTHYEFIGRIYAKWGFTNPLHPSIHPALRQMDSEVVRMVINMYNGNKDCCGAFTTGGTESILMAMKAYRDHGAAERGISDPNIVVCTTAHAAFWKAGQYFGIFVKEARATDDGEVNIKEVSRLIDSSTVAIVGSCCQYQSGTIDPIEALAAIARKKGCGLHVDCCLGGFLVPFMEKAGFKIPPFDFRVKGVTSISCDPHKYGFAPKGASVVMFSDNQYRRHMYCFCVNWSGGIYATATMTGSRAGGPVAATWAAMCKFGESGYVETTREIVGATRLIADGISQMRDLRIVGRPDVCVVAFDTAKGSMLTCYAIADCMRKSYGWELATCQKPACVHLALTLPTARNAAQFLTDLHLAIKEAHDNASKFADTAGLYGMAATFPAQFLEDGAAAYLDAATTAYASNVA